jgi:hypothetical protein
MTFSPFNRKMSVITSTVLIITPVTSATDLWAGVAQLVLCLTTDWTNGRSRFDPRHRQKSSSSSLCVQTGSRAHPASCTMGTVGRFPGGKARPGRGTDHWPHLVPTSWMSRSYTPLSLRLHDVLWDNFTFYFRHWLHTTLPERDFYDSINPRISAWDNEIKENMTLVCGIMRRATRSFRCTSEHQLYLPQIRNGTRTKGGR